MTRIEIKSRIGPDGILDLQVPCGPEDANQEVLVTVQPTRAQNGKTDWLRFISETAGSIPDPSFFRHDPGLLEERNDWA